MTTFAQFDADGLAVSLVRGPIDCPDGYDPVDVPMGTPVHHIRRLPDGSVAVIEPPARLPPPFEE